MQFDWANPYPSPRTPVFARNLVATSQPLAVQAGLRLLQQGGNAVDAAIAAAAVIALTEPCSNGLGSDNFAIVWDGTRLHGLNASGFAPAAWTPAYFHARYGADAATKRPQRGPDTVTVPGAVGGWAHLSRKFGRLGLADALAPAIGYAESGFAVSPLVHEKWRLAEPLLRASAGFAEHFLPHGRVPAIGEHFVLPGAARTLRRIADSQGADFYLGETAAAIADFIGSHGGALTRDDMAAYWTFLEHNAWVGTLAQAFAGCEVHEIPPNGQGITALIALGILRHTHIADLPLDSADWHHLQIEAIKLAFADVHAHVADPRAMRLSPATLLDDGYLRQRAGLIDMTRAQRFFSGFPPTGGTVYLATADEGGMMVSLIQSNYMGFGSGLVVPGWGISLHNRGHGFSLDPASPNVVRPHHRPFHTIIPAFLMQDGQARMAFGVMGGNMQPQGHVQALTRMLLGRQQPQAACDAPRWKFMQDLDVEVESTMPPALADALAARGHRLTRSFDSYMDFGAGQFIWRMGDPAVEGFVAASDPRRDGQAAGY